MKQLLVTTVLLIALVGCNVSENKEARIQNLESQSKQSVSKIQQLEQRIESLESRQIKNAE